MNLLQGDALLILPALPSESVDAVITDPPYCSGGAAPVSRRVRLGHKIQDADAKVKYPPVLGCSRDQRGQLAWMSLWLAECWRLARPNGALMLFSDWRQLPLFSDALQAAGWVWRSTVVWDKGERTRPNKGFFRHQAEYVLFATKGAWEAPTTNCLPGVLSFPVEPARKNHLTAKPVGLIVRLMEVLAPGAVVLDPFMGGGAVPRACVLTGRECVGIELEPESYQSAERLVVGGCLF